MKKIVLSKRLAALYDLIPKDTLVADIGCDHAWLAIELVASGKCPKAIATDLRPLPLAAARNNAIQRKVDKLIDFRCGDGLHVLQPKEVDVLVIAGMGGQRMVDVLTSSMTVAKATKKLILSPNRDVDVLRRWSNNFGFSIIDEMVIKEKQQYYEILVLVPGQSKPMTDVELYFGPVLLKCFDDNTNDYFSYKKDQYDQLKELWRRLDHPSDVIQEKSTELEQLWKKWEKIRC